MVVGQFHLFDLSVRVSAYQLVIAHKDDNLVSDLVAGLLRIFYQLACMMIVWLGNW